MERVHHLQLFSHALCPASNQPLRSSCGDSDTVCLQYHSSSITNPYCKNENTLSVAASSAYSWLILSLVHLQRVPRLARVGLQIL